MAGKLKIVTHATRPPKMGLPLLPPLNEEKRRIKGLRHTQKVHVTVQNITKILQMYGLLSACTLHAPVGQVLPGMLGSFCFHE